MLPICPAPRYDSGLASYIEILTADQDLFEQQLLLAQTRGAELRARAELYRTLGGGWQPSDHDRGRSTIGWRPKTMQTSKEVSRRN